MQSLPYTGQDTAPDDGIVSTRIKHHTRLDGVVITQNGNRNTSINSVWIWLAIGQKKQACMYDGPAFRVRSWCDWRCRFDRHPSCSLLVVCSMPDKPDRRWLIPRSMVMSAAWLSRKWIDARTTIVYTCHCYRRAQWCAELVESRLTGQTWYMQYNMVMMDRAQQVVPSMGTQLFLTLNGMHS
jgi:hypothetical protein